MEQLTQEDIRLLLFLSRLRLRNEAKRPARLDQNGNDLQAHKVWQLGDLIEKLEGIQREL